MPSDKRVVRWLIEQIAAMPSLQGAEVSTVLSPGSRNAPLSISMMEDDRYQCTVIRDERSAGYIALGKAISRKRAVILCCTSGTAALNYGPAIAEAYYQRIPLLIITADRAKHRIDQGDGQTIRQTGVFNNYVGASSVLDDGCHTDADLAYYESELIKLNACLESGLPAHINFHLAEPLYGQSIPESFSAIDYPQWMAAPKTPEDRIRRVISQAQRPMFLIGQHWDRPGWWAVLQQTGMTGWVVCTESVSQIYGYPVIDQMDSLIETGELLEKPDLHPDLIVSVGGAWVGKKLRQLLDQAGDIAHYHISVGGHVPDTFKKSVQPWYISAADFINITQESELLISESYVRRWHMYYGYYLRACGSLQRVEYSDLYVWKMLEHTLDSKYTVHLGNSSVYRYAQRIQRVGRRHYSNRGVAGIDGCASTAVGIQSDMSGDHLLILGDTTAIYDQNAWWNEIDKNKLRVLVIHNGGGGIFRIIAGPPASGYLEEVFEAGHTVSMEYGCKQHGLAYRRADHADALRQGLDWLYDVSGPALLEVWTPAADNPIVLEAYLKNITKKIKHYASMDEH